MAMKKELQARPTEKIVDDLRKKVKILQVILLFILMVLYVTSCFGLCAIRLTHGHTFRQWVIILLRLKTGKWLQVGRR